MYMLVLMTIILLRSTRLIYRVTSSEGTGRIRIIYTIAPTTNLSTFLIRL